MYSSFHFFSIILARGDDLFVLPYDVEIESSTRANTKRNDMQIYPF
tara:strand:+ start:665 stop:802 length:138 start_codon:yes stop_codon:yes gene_type:complete